MTSFRCSIARISGFGDARWQLGRVHHVYIGSADHLAPLSLWRAGAPISLWKGTYVKKKARTNQPDLVIDQIKHEIIFGRLRPRERLVEDDLCKKFGASRHQIRAAFTELERIGLVTRRPNKGVVVRDFSAEEIEQSFEVGALLQAEAAQRIPLPLDAEAMRGLDDIYKAYCTASSRLDLEQVVANTMRFYQTVFEASNNKCLSEIIREIWTKTLAVRCYEIAIPELLERERQEHAQILQALRSGNRRDLIRLCADQGKRALEAYKRLHGGWASQGRAAHVLAKGEPAELKRRTTR
jgi:DNA-binding GntR family transcriptional regulator